MFGRNGPAPPEKSEVHLFRNGKGVINLNAEIPDGALNLGVAEPAAAIVAGPVKRASAEPTKTSE